MASAVQICNLALSRVGGARITSLTDGTQEAILCNTLLNDITEEVMAEGEWASLIRRATLNVTTNTPAFGFDYEFQLPTNPQCLKALSINEDITGSYDYRIEGDKLLANVSGCKLRYIGRETDTAKYGPWLKRAIVSRLAAELAYPITGNANLSESLYRRYLQELADGLANDGQQGSDPGIDSSEIDEVR